MGEVRVGLVGAGWMGKAHALAYKNVPLVFGPEPAVPKLEMFADVDPDWARAAAQTLGFARWIGDWRALVQDPAIDLVDICAPNDVHGEIALVALDAGKAVDCEKLELQTAPTVASYADQGESSDDTSPSVGRRRGSRRVSDRPARCVRPAEMGCQSRVGPFAAVLPPPGEAS